MNAHEMVEHMIGSFKVANGKIGIREIVTPLERLDKLQAFIMSDIPFKENTKNALMGNVQTLFNICILKMPYMNWKTR